MHLLVGLVGLFSKIGSVSANPLQLQILFTLGMLPVALAMLLQMRWKLDRNLAGAAFGILSGFLQVSELWDILRPYVNKTLRLSLQSPDCFPC